MIIAAFAALYSKALASAQPNLLRLFLPSFRNNMM